MRQKVSHISAHDVSCADKVASIVQRMIHFNESEISRTHNRERWSKYEKKQIEMPATLFPFLYVALLFIFKIVCGIGNKIKNQIIRN